MVSAFRRNTARATLLGEGERHETELAESFFDDDDGTIDADDSDCAVSRGEAQFRQSCMYCHSYGGAPIEPPRPGLDLMASAMDNSDTWLGAWIDYPAEMVAAGAYDVGQLASYPYLMPDLLHPPTDVWDMVDFLVGRGSTPIESTPPVTLRPEEVEASRQVYFNLCAGCHGLYGTGATGPDIGAARSQAIARLSTGFAVHILRPSSSGRHLCAISKATGALDHSFRVATNGRAVHIEFNMDGSQVWISDWDPDGAVIVLDATTLTEIRRFTGLPTPTGKFNVYNTAHDIY